MTDINLLPDDLKKREEKILHQKGGFSNSSIEFTSGKPLSEIEKNVSFNSSQESEKNNSNVKIKSFRTLNNNLDFPKNKEIENKKVLDLDGVKDKTKTFVLRENNINTLAESKKEIKNISKDKKQNIKQNIVVDTNLSKKSRKNFFKLLKKFFDNLINKKDNSESGESNVNLLPKELNIINGANITTMILATFLISIIIGFVFYFGIVIYKINIDKRINSIDQKIENIVNNPEEFDSLILKIEDLKRRNEKIKSLLSKHIYWTEFFSQLEKHTLPEIKFTSFAGSTNGNITLASSAPDYYTVARQWLELKNNAKNFVDDVLVEGASASGAQSSGIDTRINFSLILDLNDSVFYKNQ